MFNNQEQQSGMIIILAILIIAAVLATAVAFGNLIIREIRQARLIDQSMQAYYFAESGSERALHQVRKREGVVDCSILGGIAPFTCDDTSHCRNVPAMPCISTDGGALGDWITEPRKEEKTIITLGEGQTFQVDLFDITEIANSAIDQIGIDFDDPSVTLLGELSNLTKVLGIPGLCLFEQQILKDFISSPPVILNGLQGSNILPDCSYIFKLNYPSNTDGTQDFMEVTIQVFDQSAVPPELDIPSRLIIKTDATFGDSSQTINVRTPIRPPLSGLYDFVLFSEEDLVKDTTTTP